MPRSRHPKALGTFAAFLCFFLLPLATTHAQSALDGFDPNANGVIRAIVVQPDGKILIGGDFTTLSPNGGASITRNRIARLNPDGTLDTGFNPNANNAVRSLAVQADGKVLVGGDFANIGGQPRSNIARLDATTGLADTFDPNASSTVFALAVQTDGKILAGGFFATIGGQTRNRLARLDPATGLADSFDPNPSGTGTVIYSIAVQGDGKILAGGFFSSIAGAARRNLARLDPMTGAADSFDPQASDEVRAVALQADGKVLLGGFFTLVAGQSRNSIARLDATTGLPDSFNPNANNGVFALAVQTDGKILVGGDFFGIGGQQRHQIARLDPGTGLADSFNPNGNNSVNAIAVQPDGKILAGGGFTTLSPNGGPAVTRNRIARLETDGRLDRTFDPSNDAFVIWSTAVQPDGKIVLAGRFTTVLGVPRNSIARFNTDGTLDAAFNPDASADVKAVAVQADGKILAAGVFNSIGGQNRNHLARLDATTGVPDSFNPSVNQTVNSVAVQPDGKILVGGQFNGPNSVGAQTRNFIARIDPTTGLADSFNPNANGPLVSIVVQADGNILAVGGFTNIGGQPRNRIARLDGTTGLADSFNPNANGSVFATVLQTDGKILVGGVFTSIGGQPRSRIARLDATGLADSFNPSANDQVESIALQADGKIVVGGEFTNIGGQARNRIARLDPATGLADSFHPDVDSSFAAVTSQADGKILAAGVFSSVGGQPRSLVARITSDTAALQNLTVTQTSITWTRAGSSPQFTRVTFESSADNLNYAFLGSATAAGSDWTLTGLNLPTGLNIYVRARGFYHSGDGNVSQSIGETVRNVFLPGPTPTPTATPATPTPSPTPTPTITPSPTISPTPTPTPTTTPCIPNPVVTTNADSGPGSLRQAIADACPGSTITFNMSQVVSPIVLTSGGLGSTKGLAINGPGAAQLSITTNSQGSIFVAGGASPTVVNVSGLTLTGAHQSQQGALFNAGSGALNVLDCVVSDSTASVGGGGITNTTGTTNIINTTVNGNTTPGSGGGIFNGSGTINISNSTISNNSSLFAGGGGGISNTSTGTVNVTNCTISNNSATTQLGSNFGGGIHNGQTGAVTVTNSTIANNTSVNGGGISNASSGAFRLRNTIVALNTGTTSGPDATGTFVTQGHNLIGKSDGSTGFTPGLNGDHVGTNASPIDPQLGPLANNGGPTMTRALTNGSPAIGAGDNAAITNPPFSGPPFFDQRGTGFPRIVNSTVDIGAFEAAAATPTPTPTPSPTPTTPTPTPSPSVSPTPTPTPTATPTPTVSATATPTPSSTPTPTATPGTLGNISTRLRVLAGDNALIGGMIATGTAPKKVIIRAIGPTLNDFGVPGALQDPTLELYQGSTLLTSNDDWRQSPQQSEIENSGLAPNKDAESAIIATLTPNQNYTAIVHGKNGSTGVGVVEAFDLDQAAASKLGNISTRGFVDVDDNVMIAGLIVSPSNGTSTKVLVRALGPTLGDFGVPGFLANPTLDLVNSSGTVIRSNDDWRSDQESEIEAANLAPSHNEEAALVQTVPPGAYTAVVRGSGRTTGVGLVEAYNIQ